MNYNAYIDIIDLYKKTEKEKILYTSYYFYQTKIDKKFSFEELKNLLKENGIYISNSSRARLFLKESRDFKKVENNQYTLTRFALKKLSNEITLQFSHNN